MAERRKRSLLMPQLRAPVIVNLTSSIPTVRLLILSLMTLSKTMHLDAVTAGPLTGRKRIVSRAVMMITETVMPVPWRDEGPNAIANISGIMSEVETANCDIVRGIVTIDIVTIDIVTIDIVVMTSGRGSDTGVATEIETVTVDDTMTSVTADTINQRIPILLRGARREVALGHGEIQSHARVAMSLQVVDTGAEIGKSLSLYKVCSF